MAERITRENVERRLENLNRRFTLSGSPYRWSVEGAYGKLWLYRDDRDGGRIATITAGTKREIAEFLWAAMVAIDDTAPAGDYGKYSVPRACSCGAEYVDRAAYWACRLSHENTNA
jgi:hypothetical protein